MPVRDVVELFVDRTQQIVQLEARGHACDLRSVCSTIDAGSGLPVSLALASSTSRSRSRRPETAVNTLSAIDWIVELSTIQRVELIRIGELARRSGVSIPTLKFYLREGLIAPARKSGRTMAYYDVALIARIHAIKELQQDQFLPLEVIRETLDRDAEAPDDAAAAEAIAKVLARHGGKRSRSREELLARGAAAPELDWLARAGLAVPGPDDRYRGDDLALLSTLGAARRAGIAAEMLPFEILGEYLAALNQLVAVELRMYRAGVLANARSRDIGRLTTAATKLSERLVVLLRRRLLLPTLNRIIEEETREARPLARGRRSLRRRQHRPARRRTGSAG
jgi:DNA-binding transcriptional MerR regulator